MQDSTTAHDEPPTNEHTSPEHSHLSHDTQLLLMKKQNDRLRQELKAINEFLTQAIVKQGNKKTTKPQSKDLRDDTLKHEMTNAQKQIDTYRKEINKLNAKVEREYRPEIVDKMKQDISEKDQLINKLTLENKALVKVQRIQSQALKDVEDESYKKQISLLIEENKVLKEQIKEIKKKEPTLPVIIRNYYQTPEDKAKEVNPGQRRLHSSSKSSKDDSDKIIEMEKNIQILQKIRKQYDVQIEQLYSRIKVLEEQNSALTRQLEEKNKEFNVVNYRVQHQPNTLTQTKKNLNESADMIDSRKRNGSQVEVKRQSPPQSTVPVRQPIRSARKTVQVSAKKPVEEAKQEEQPVHEVQVQAVVPPPAPPPAQVRHIEKGTINASNQRFTDTDITKVHQHLKVLSSYIVFKKIGQMRVWTDESSYIKGVQAIYVDAKGNRIDGSENIVTGNNSYIVNSTEFHQFDYLKQMSGRIGLTGNIEFLEFVSQQNKIFRCGVEQVGQRKFKFEIAETEVPFSVFGSLNLKSNQSVLASLGFEVVRDEVVEEF